MKQSEFGGAISDEGALGKTGFMHGGALGACWWVKQLMRKSKRQ